MNRDGVTFGFGVFGIPPEEIVKIAARADRLGFDWISIGDQTVRLDALNLESADPSLLAALATPFDHSDPFVLAAAVLTEAPHLEFFTTVFVLPLHNPLVMARAATGVQKLSGGRLVLGVGSGVMEEEYLTLKVPFESRGARFDEAIEVVKRASEGGSFVFSGEFFDFPQLTVTSRPAPVPIVVGGPSKRAFRRAAELGDGWYSMASMTAEDCSAAKRAIEAMRAEKGTDGKPFTYTIALPDIQPDVVAPYLEAGFRRFNLMGRKVFPDPTVSLGHKLEAIEEVAAVFDLVPRVGA